MTLDRTACYRALTARDPRFDGLFFVGVTSTGIYCRPVCRARTPRAANCRFFSNAAAAERSGFRPCLRCRPELAPGNAPVDAMVALAERAASAIARGALNQGSVDDLAESLGVTGRHLRRAVGGLLGVTPIDLATTHRLLLAKRLLHETSLPIGQVAHAAGFESLRRFNAAFKAKYRLAPGELRRSIDGEATRPGAGAARSAAPRRGDGAPPALAGRRSRTDEGVAATGRVVHTGETIAQDVVELSLEYRAPLHWDALLAFLAARAAPGAELVAEGWYHATVQIPASGAATLVGEGKRPPASAPSVLTGHVSVGLQREEGHARSGSTSPPARHAVIARLSPSLIPVLMPLLARLRDLLDLDANPDVIARHLVREGVVASARAFAGVRVPGSLDAFALAVRAILGQQVSVRGATTLMSRLVERFGEPYAGGGPSLTRLMPTPARLATLSTSDIATLGMPGARADAVLALARAMEEGTLQLSPGGDVPRTMRTLTALPGIGDWTAHYIAMRALRWPDAFPASDLVLRKAAGHLTPAQLLRRAEPWRPWRAYAAMHLWRTSSQTSDR